MARHTETVPYHSVCSNYDFISVRFVQNFNSMERRLCPRTRASFYVALPYYRNIIYSVAFLTQRNAITVYKYRLRVDLFLI